MSIRKKSGERQPTSIKTKEPPHTCNFNIKIINFLLILMFDEEWMAEKAIKNRNVNPTKKIMTKKKFFIDYLYQS